MRPFRTHFCLEKPPPQLRQGTAGNGPSGTLPGEIPYLLAGMFHRLYRFGVNPLLQKVFTRGELWIALPILQQPDHVRLAVANHNLAATADIQLVTPAATHATVDGATAVTIPKCHFNLLAPIGAVLNVRYRFIIPHYVKFVKNKLTVFFRL